jgi:hypothetical protein
MKTCENIFLAKSKRASLRTYRPVKLICAIFKKVFSGAAGYFSFKLVLISE